MPTSNEKQTQIADALNNLASTVEQMQRRYDATQRTNRIMMVVLFMVTVGILAGAGYVVMDRVSTLASAISPRKFANLDPEAAAEERKRLKQLLPADMHAQIEEFEAEVKWVHDYLQVFDDFDAGAAMTLFLGQMSSSVEVMPAMYAEVRSMKQEMQSLNDQILTMNQKMDALPVLAHDVQGMNGKMNALPALTLEVQGIHRQVTGMSVDMDSTMGRFGRIVPW